MLKYSARGYDHAELSQSALDINPRQNKFLSSTGFSNHNLNSTKLPTLSRSLSSSSKSTKLKLTAIDATLSSLSQDIHGLKLDTRQSRRFANYLRDELGEAQLGSLKLELQTSANKLEKTFKIAKKHDEDRGRQLKLDCDQLKESSKKLKGMMELLASKLDNCERVMGLYSGKEKHKL